MRQIRGLTIGQISDRTGLAVSAIRFYEEKGLVTPDRTSAGQRRYEGADIRRLSFVMISQQLGFSLAEIQELFAGLPEGAPPPRPTGRASVAGSGAILMSGSASLRLYAKSWTVASAVAACR